ncbi:MAG: hypothetical protein JW746_10645 [Candidatus Krumholzibacteriota bacterium]|nr:hypothetical protein [Candidatus Krumholzibacteriota bacterium]
MAGKYEEIDLNRIKTVSIAERGSKVTVSDYGDPVKGGKAFRHWMDALPDQLAVKRIRKLVLAFRRALSSKEREMVWMIGAHVVKCGLSPYLTALMKKGYITALAVNGAVAIHDLEIAFFGETSEDVAVNLEKGIFGFSAETADRLFHAVGSGFDRDLGLGESIGRYILEEKAPNADKSLLAQAYRNDIPVTMHISIGTDIVNQHPGFDGAKWGALSARDFRIFCHRIERIGRSSGVVLNVGSAVILPEVFLKAYSVARNLGASFGNLTTANIDMIQHYRPGENLLKRPGSLGAETLAITGHHEIMIPVLYSALMS